VNYLKILLLIAILASPPDGAARGKAPTTQTAPHQSPTVESSLHLVLRTPELTPNVFICPTTRPSAHGDVPGGVRQLDSPSTQPASDSGPTTRVSMALLEHIQQQLRSVETIEADFVQEKQLSVLNHKVTITGHMALQKPDKLVWIVRQPVKYAIRIEGEEIRQWDEDTNQVQVIHLGGDPTFAAVTQQLQAWFMGDYKTLGDSYDVSLLGEHPLRLAFVPKGQSMVAKALKRVDLTFGKSERYIDEMVISEASGDATTLQFNNTQINQPIPKETWEIPPHER
jgi:outer membrane lipoprotein carrier protein